MKMTNVREILISSLIFLLDHRDLAVYLDEEALILGWENEETI